MEAGGAGRMSEGALPELPGGWVWTRMEIGKIQIEAFGIGYYFHRPLIKDISGKYEC
ncbi:MAG: hypothetical protein Q8O41_04190 [Candidatus Methanoperedens sp.]|nr:hypothetical protein [Candidatus Methanoperedens sp.]